MLKAKWPQVHESVTCGFFIAADAVATACWKLTPRLRCFSFGNERRVQFICGAQIVRPCQLVVCEKSGDWAGALRRFLVVSDDLPTLRETRNLKQCLNQIEHSPESFVVLEVTLGNIVDVIEAMQWCSVRFPRCRFVVVAEQNIRRYQWLLREHGAIDVIFSRATVRRMIGQIVRHWTAVADVKMGLRESILSRLPWKYVAAR